MNNIIPRFEFRAFSDEFPEIEAKMNELSKVEKTREISEIYLITRVNSENNVKIRNKKLDIKVLIQTKNNLEQWLPHIIGDFPMSANLLENEVYPSLGVSAPVFEKEEYKLEDFIKNIIKEDPDVVAAFTKKIRKAYTINHCICEIADVFVNKAKIKTIAIESENPDLVEETRQLLGFDESYENVNYPKAIKRIMGLEDWPDQF